MTFSFLDGSLLLEKHEPSAGLHPPATTYIHGSLFSIWGPLGRPYFEPLWRQKQMRIEVREEQQQKNRIRSKVDEKER
jgi:hypothetical protein